MSAHAEVSGSGAPAPLPFHLLDGVVAGPAELARALRARLEAHPVPQSDARTRGLLVELAGPWRAGAAPRLDGVPGMDALLGRLAAGADAHYLVAVNETPPSDTGTFFMRPHVDRRWSAGGFGGPPPRWTTVVFLDFPAEGRGGELVVFPPGTLAGGAPVPREGARGFTERAGGVRVDPVPGRACRMAGDLPHAVLGYSAPPGSAWRLALVVAEFDPDPPPAEGR